MKTLILLFVWAVLMLILWVFVIKTIVDSPNNKFKHYENKIKSFFYFLAVILSLILGILI